MEYWPDSRLYEGRFGRLFRALPALRLTEEQAQEIADLMVEAGDDREQSNPRIPAATPTSASSSITTSRSTRRRGLQKRNDPDALRNFRTPAFDLDCLYGRGPDDQPYLYDWTPGREGRFLIGRGQGGEEELDLPRNAPPDLPDDPDADVPRRALIGDPRNDENILVSQLHLTMLMFHNRVMDHLDGSGGNGAMVPRQLEKLAAKLQDRPWQERFDVAQDVVRWHYQWMVIFDFVRRVVGDKTLGHVLERRPSRYEGVEKSVPSLEFYKPKYDAYMPVEFSVAAYRFGHSMIRNTYRLNSVIPPQNVRLLIFNLGAATSGFERLGHLGGFRQLPPRWPVEWRFFFDLGDAVQPPRFVQSSRKIDMHLAAELSRLPDNVATGIKALAQRNLMRGSTMGLPSGQDVAAAMGFRPLGRKQLGLGGRPAPLWFYILKEAEVGGGEQLGPVGGHIVAEVFVGLLVNDSSSWLKRRPAWKPFLGREEGTFTMPDLIRFAGYGLNEISF